MYVLLRSIARNGLQDAIRHKADFDWHGKLILELGERLPLIRRRGCTVVDSVLDG